MTILHDLRFERTVAVAWDVDLDRTGVLGQDLLGAFTVARVPAPTPGLVMRCVAEVVDHLLIQSGLDHGLRQRFRQSVRTGERHSTRTR